MVDRIMVEESGVAQGTAKHRAVLAISCILEGGIALAFTIAVVHMSLSGLGTSSLGRSEIPSIDVAAFIILPFIAVAVGALPVILRDGLDRSLLRGLGVSVLVCIGAALVYFPLLLVAGGLSVRYIPEAASLLSVGFVSTIPFVLVPLLVDRWA